MEEGQDALGHHVAHVRQGGQLVDVMPEGGVVQLAAGAGAGAGAV